MTGRNDERGFVLITAISVLMIVLLLGLALIATVNVQTHQTGVEKAGEAAFDLAESALDAEAHQVEVAWPGTAATALPTACNQSTPDTVGCDGTALTAALSAQYAGPTYANATWTAQTLDDLGSGSSSTNCSNSTNESYYSDALAKPGADTSWDCNGDNRVWVRAEATVEGQTRILVEQLIRQDSELTVPDNTVTAGGIYTENAGNKIIIEARDGESGLTGPVEVRCGTAGSQPAQGSDPCLGWSASKGQLDPPTAYGAGYVDPDGGYQTLTTDQINALIQTAQANNTYFTSCPPDGTAGVVVVQFPSGEENTNCSYSGKTSWNAPPLSPGALVFLNGTLSISGTEQFYGVIYMANQQGQVPTSGACTSAQMNTVVTVTGNASVNGAVFADRCGVVGVGDSSTNINFASNSLNGLYVADAATPAQNTFRIVPNS